MKIFDPFISCLLLLSFVCSSVFAISPSDPIPNSFLEYLNFQEEGSVTEEYVKGIESLEVMDWLTHWQSRRLLLFSEKGKLFTELVTLHDLARDPVLFLALYESKDFSYFRGWDEITFEDMKSLIDYTEFDINDIPWELMQLEVLEQVMRNVVKPIKAFPRNDGFFTKDLIEFATNESSKLWMSVKDDSKDPAYMALRMPNYCAFRQAIYNSEIPKVLVSLWLDRVEMVPYDLVAEYLNYDISKIPWHFLPTQKLVLLVDSIQELLYIDDENDKFISDELITDSTWKVFRVANNARNAPNYVKLMVAAAADEKMNYDRLESFLWILLTKPISEDAEIVKRRRFLYQGENLFLALNNATVNTALYPLMEVFYDWQNIEPKELVSILSALADYYPLAIPPIFKIFNNFDGWNIFRTLDTMTFSDRSIIKTFFKCLLLVENMSGVEGIDLIDRIEMHRGLMLEAIPDVFGPLDLENLIRNGMFKGNSLTLSIAKNLIINLKDYKSDTPPQFCKGKASAFFSDNEYYCEIAEAIIGLENIEGKGNVDSVDLLRIILNISGMPQVFLEDYFLHQQPTVDKLQFRVLTRYLLLTGLRRPSKVYEFLCKDLAKYPSEVFYGKEDMDTLFKLTQVFNPEDETDLIYWVMKALFIKTDAQRPVFSEEKLATVAWQLVEGAPEELPVRQAYRLKWFRRMARKCRGKVTIATKSFPSSMMGCLIPLDDYTISLVVDGSFVKDEFDEIMGTTLDGPVAALSCTIRDFAETFIGVKYTDDTGDSIEIGADGKILYPLPFWITQKSLELMVLYLNSLQNGDNVDWLVETSNLEPDELLNLLELFDYLSVDLKHI